MARPERLNRVVARLIEAKQITPAMSRKAVETVYARVCERERLPVWTVDGWEPWETARPWGEGPNEYFQDFLQEILIQLWGRIDVIPQSWPDEVPITDRELAAEIGCHPASLDDALWLRSQPEMWNHYLAIVADRPWPSEYHFCNLRLFAEAVRVFGAERVLCYPHAKTWALMRRLVKDENLTINEAFVLHVPLNTTRPVQAPSGAWKALIEQWGLARVARILRAMPQASPTAVELALAIHGAEQSAYYQEMAPWIKPNPRISIQRLKDALVHQPWSNVRGEYRWRLLAGQSPKEIADIMEPGAGLSDSSASEWIGLSQQYRLPGQYLRKA